MNLILIGFSGAGKSTLIQKLIREKKWKVRGYVSEKLENLREEEGVPVYIMSIPKNYKPSENLKEKLEKSIVLEQRTLSNKCACAQPALTAWADNHPGPMCIGFSCDGHATANVCTLDLFARNFLMPLAQQAKKGQIIILDEIGVMESKSEIFREAIFQLLDGPATVVAAVREKHTDFLDQVKNHPDNRCFVIEESNRDTIYEELRRLL
ncbi:MAG: nucleoside-triphosphatase [Lachnospiraceae bacterium]|nr:nucleoside-triphosphatase [Lachnospiraceae bacterium]